MGEVGRVPATNQSKQVTLLALLAIGGIVYFVVAVVVGIFGGVDVVDCLHWNKLR
ncbi:MAG TPA: hypothetical protein VNW73_14405 [Ktedonobacteraceae bacterium]|jgi:hypothetical protein|nr:hypothetical protein [Ktedonobacteraceae bacterium]